MFDYKVWQNELQSALGITKCGRVDYKVHQGLQSVVGLQSELVQMPACNERPHILNKPAVESCIFSYVGMAFCYKQVLKCQLEQKRRCIKDFIYLKR